MMGGTISSFARRGCLFPSTQQFTWWRIATNLPREDYWHNYRKTTQWPCFNTQTPPEIFLKGKSFNTSKINYQVICRVEGRWSEITVSSFSDKQSNHLWAWSFASDHISFLLCVVYIVLCINIIFYDILWWHPSQLNE